MAKDATGPMESSYDGAQLDALIGVLQVIRSHGTITRPRLAHESGLGRTVVTQRTRQLLELGVLKDGEMAPSTGGRAAREIRFRSEAARVFTAEVGATGISTGVADLAGHTRAEQYDPIDVARGPEDCLSLLERRFDDLLATAPDVPLWGIGVGLPGPVEFASGRPVSPPIMPGWDGYPVRDRLQARYGVPVWVDNDVNVMALGEQRVGLARDHRNALFVKLGSGIGAGLISDGRLHRGEQGCAGDIGHIAVAEDDATVCRCGNRGCLEALAGGAALARDGLAAAQEGRSAYLARVLAANGDVTAADVSEGAGSGDHTCRDLLVHAGTLIGETLASLVNFFNPSLIVVGGGVSAAGDILLAAIREATYRRALPLATRDLRLTRSALGRSSGLTGAAYMVVDELFSRALLPQWLEAGSPNALAGVR